MVIFFLKIVTCKLLIYNYEYFFINIIKKLIGIEKYVLLNVIENI